MIVGRIILVVVAALATLLFSVGYVMELSALSGNSGWGIACSVYVLLSEVVPLYLDRPRIGP